MQCTVKKMLQPSGMKVETTITAVYCTTSGLTSW